jgi:hypothetical protein
MPDSQSAFLRDLDAEPGELLRDALTDAGMSPTELGKRLGYANPYLTVKRWIDGRGFNAENQAKVAEVLGLSAHHFAKPDLDAYRERYRIRVFAEFLRTEIGEHTTPEERRVLGSARFNGKLLPSVNLYTAWALSLQGRITLAQVVHVAADNEAADRELAEHAIKPPRGKK